MDAAGKGFTTVVHWLIYQHSPMVPDCGEVFMEAVCFGHLETVELFNHYCSSADCYEHALSDVGENGHLAMVEWLFHNLRTSSKSHQRAEECAVARAGTSLAARNGHLDIVKWLVETSTLHSFNLSFAVDSGQLEMLTWLHENTSNAICSPIAMDRAAERGHLHIVQWLHENRTEGFTKKAMNHAAKNGHLHVV